MTELEDEGIQFPGRQAFEYAMQFGEGEICELPNKAAELFTPIKCAVSGRGKGELAHERSLFGMDNKNLHVTAVERADDGDGIIVRLYNPTYEKQPFRFSLERGTDIEINTMAEEFVEKTGAENTVEPKKIMTYRIRLHK